MTPPTDLPVVSPPDPNEVPESQRRVAGILLAAGASARFGEANKLLARVDGDPLVAHAARPLVTAELDPLIAVVGYEADRVIAALNGLPLTFVKNDEYEDGQATSVRTGVKALPADVDAAVFALGDMPNIDFASVRALAAAYRAGSGTALAASCDGRRGNPVLFDSINFDSLTKVSGDTGGRRILLESDDAALVETGDSGVHHDVDTPDDLNKQ